MNLALFENELPSWIKSILDLWPIGVAVVGVIVIVIAWRYLEKAGIDKANEKAVNALKELVAARDQELADRDEHIERLETDCTAKQAAFVALESEYKAIAGIVLAELMIWVGRYDEHRAALAAKDSEIRVLKMQLDAMERQAFDLHTSKP